MFVLTNFLQELQTFSVFCINTFKKLLYVCRRTQTMTDYDDPTRCGRTAEQLKRLLDIQNTIEFKDAIRILKQPRENDALYFSPWGPDHCWVMRYEDGEWVVYQSFIKYFLPRQDRFPDQEELVRVFKNSASGLQKDSDALWNLLKCHDGFPKHKSTLVEGYDIYSNRGNNGRIVNNSSVVHENSIVGFLCGTLFTFVLFALATVKTK